MPRFSPVIFFVAVVGSLSAQAPSAFVSRVDSAAVDLPPALRSALHGVAEKDASRFLHEIDTLLSGDPFLVRLVDKAHALPDDYEPADLVKLRSGIYTVTRDGLALRTPAEHALAEMATQARTQGIPLAVSSCYRSARYQQTVYSRVVAQLGQAAADRESARPGHSQHQLGLAVDFGSIDDSFATTKASAWLSAHAAEYGWSLSFPHGMEAVTGYRWESWHYRYVGTAAARFIDTYFNGVQQYALVFLDAWKRQK